MSYDPQLEKKYHVTVYKTPDVKKTRTVIGEAKLDAYTKKLREEKIQYVVTELVEQQLLTEDAK